MTVKENIITRNFFRIVRSGAFNEYEPVERMSAFKWNKLFGMAMQQNIMPIVANGMRNSQYDKSGNLPTAVVEMFFGLYDKQNAATRVTIPQSNMSNSLLNKRLRKLRHDELHAIDTSLETLELLNIIIYNTNNILANGIFFGSVILIGMYMRSKGDKVDYVKLERWLQTLGLQKMAQFEGSILISTLNFDQSELPFVHEVDANAYKRAMHSLTDAPMSSLDDWRFKQGQSGFMHNNGSVLRHNLWHKMKYLNYAPMETTSNLMHNMAKSLSQIEE